MTTLVKVTRPLLLQALDDLSRPHPFAHERLGFFSFRQAIADGEPILLCYEYHSIPDGQYIPDSTCGARINGDAIRAAMSRSYKNRSGELWVHMHARRGNPGTSRTDDAEGPKVVQSCANAQPQTLHGWAVISEDGIAGEVRALDGRFHPIRDLAVVGWPMTLPRRPGLNHPKRRWWAFWQSKRRARSNQYQRQSFLGPEAQAVIERARIGIIGLGGGGSHVSQQLAHLGFQNVVLCDTQRIEDTNLNRLVGGTDEDVLESRLKTEIAARVFRSVQPEAIVDARPLRWEEKRDVLRTCDILVAGVDSFGCRRDLESFCRRHFIPLVDIGMKVVPTGPGSSEIHGQVILSMPGEPCMKCLQFLTDENLGNEAEDYNAGPQPQVVWPNGVLASSAVGYVVGLLTGWSGTRTPCARVDYRGSGMSISNSHIAEALKGRSCKHFPLSQGGDPIFTKL